MSGLQTKLAALRPTRGLVVLLGLAISMGLPALATAQQGQSAAAGQAKGQATTKLSEEQIQAFKDAQKRYKELKQRISDIQKQALENNPQLEKDQQALKDLVMQTMRDGGAEPQKSMDRIEELKGQLKDKDMSKEKRKSLMKELRSESMAVRQAQKKALKTKEVKQARSDLRQQIIEAMKEEEPKTEQLMQELKDQRKKMRSILSQARSGSQDGG